MMRYEHLQVVIANSPSLRLLRAKNAPLIVSFLWQAFKDTPRITIPHRELLDDLTAYLEFLRDAEAAEEAPVRAKLYLEAWCSDESNYLRKYTDDQGVDVHELTPYTETVLQWLQELERQDFVGTESRLLDIFRKVKDLVENSLEDPTHKLTLLYQQKAALERQIEAIETSGVVKAFNDTQIKERFFEVNRAAKQLLSDFRQVEQNFRDVVRTIYEKQADKDVRKGEILAYVLNQTDALQLSDQGRSFYTFWQVLMDRGRREELDQAVEEVYDVLARRQIEADDWFLSNMKFYLLEAGKKVIDSNHLLVEKLQRILSSQSSQERKRTLELIADIKRAALKLIAAPPHADDFLEIDSSPSIQLIMERPLGEEPQEAEFYQHPLEIGSDDFADVDFELLLSQFEINKEAILNRIAQHLNRQPRVTLLEILRAHPLENGLAELLTYFSIASQSSKHQIQADQFDLVPLHRDGGRVARMPQIVFIK